tara:strand:- start:705 stop:935 length:231 start_codon:yes stop_codon:yes gene_type:complete
MNIYLELLGDASLIPDSGKIIRLADNFFFQNVESAGKNPAYLSQTGTTITKSDRGYVEFNYFYFEKSKPNKLSGVL